MKLITNISKKEENTSIKRKITFFGINEKTGQEIAQKFMSIFQTGILNDKEPLQVFLSLINAKSQKIRAP